LLTFQLFDRQRYGVLNLCEVDDLCLALAHTLAKIKGPSLLPSKEDLKEKDLEYRSLVQLYLKEVESTMQNIVGSEKKITYSQLHDGVMHSPLLSPCFKSRSVACVPILQTGVVPRKGVCVDVEQLIRDCAVNEGVDGRKQKGGLGDFEESNWNPVDQESSSQDNQNASSNSELNEEEGVIDSDLKEREGSVKKKKKKKKKEKEKEKENDDGVLDEIEARLSTIDKEHTEFNKRKGKKCLIQ